jgi:hypothetical protein
MAAMEVATMGAFNSMMAKHIPGVITSRGQADKRGSNNSFGQTTVHRQEKGFTLHFGDETGGIRDAFKPLVTRLCCLHDAGLGWVHELHVPEEQLIDLLSLLTQLRQKSKVPAVVLRPGGFERIDYRICRDEGKTRISAVSRRGTNTVRRT